MTNVLIEGPEHIPSFELAVKDYNLYKRVIPINVRSKLTRNISPDDVSWCDVLISIRGGDPLSCYLVTELVKAGRKVVILLDDDLLEKRWDIPYFYSFFNNSLKKVICKSVCLQTPSRYLGEKYRKIFNLRYSIVDTVIDSSQFKSARRNSDGVVKLLYAAGESHSVFFNVFISPILDRLYIKYGNKVSLTIIGPDVDIMGAKLKITKIASMPMEKYRIYMKENEFDIGLAPLFDDEFCRSKYYNKYIEYSINGICGVFSNLIPYSSIIRNNITGILSSNNCDAWYYSICKLIDDDELRCECVRRAQEQLRLDFNLHSIANRVFTDMKDIFTYKAPLVQRKTCRFMYIRYLILRIKLRAVRFYYGDFKISIFRRFRL